MHLWWSYLLWWIGVSIVYWWLNIRSTLGSTTKIGPLATKSTYRTRHINKKHKNVKSSSLALDTCMHMWIIKVSGHSSYSTEYWPVLVYLTVLQMIECCIRATFWNFENTINPKMFKFWYFYYPISLGHSCTTNHLFYTLDVVWDYNPTSGLGI